MEKRIELEKRRRPSSEIEELILDNCRSTTIEGLTDEFVNLKSLSLISVGLTSLKGFPKLPKLRKLELSDNRISGGLQALNHCEKLTVLNLSNNKIKDFESLEPLKELKSLKNLDLYRNEVTSTENYRERVFNLLPELAYLDNADKTGKECEESDLDDEDEINDANGKDESQDADGDEKDDEEGGSEVEEEEDEEDGEEEEEDVGLKDIYKDFDKDSDDEDYEAGEGSEGEDEDIEEEESVLEPQEERRGVKRQHEDAEESD